MDATVVVLIICLSSSTYLCNHANGEEIFEGIKTGEHQPAPQLAQDQKPTVMIAVLVRNKAHTLPFFLHYLEKLHYPKHRIGLWFRSDHNSDGSTFIVDEWLNQIRDEYHWVDFVANDTETDYPGQKTTCHWTEDRFRRIIMLRQEALNTARKRWVDFLFMLDADCLLENEMVLSDLIRQEKTIVAPLLNTTASKFYANFWAGMRDSGYYARTERYIPILHRKDTGCHVVAMVHSAVLINLRHRHSLLLAYHPAPLGYRGPDDDIIQFASSARQGGIPMYVLNEYVYGVMMMPMEEHNSLEQEQEQFIHVKLERIVKDRPLTKLPYIHLTPPMPNKLGFDQIYMINLERRPDRHQKMMDSFVELGIDAKVVNAVDGRQLTEDYLDELGVQMLDGYADPYHKRALTMGEIGCFLSHYFIWQDIVLNDFDQVIVFEDDIRFQVYFKSKLRLVMQDVNRRQPDWDLIYIGRKKLNHEKETWLGDSKLLVWPDYSYWTLGYLLSKRGAQKLLAQKPLSKMIPVDEYLPVMFDRHSEEKWKNAFSPRDLVALSAEPLLIEPTHYTGEPGYITDTEVSDVITVEKDTENSVEKNSPNTDSGTVDAAGIDSVGHKREL